VPTFRLEVPSFKMGGCVEGKGVSGDLMSSWDMGFGSVNGVIPGASSVRECISGPGPSIVIRRV
jgi:hypothetical protein